MKELTTDKSSIEKRKKYQTKENFKPYSSKFIIKLNLLRCRPTKTSFKNSTPPERNTNGADKASKGEKSGWLIAFAIGLLKIKSKIADEKLKIKRAKNAPRITCDSSFDLLCSASFVDR
jgi:hypothetical protein